MKSLSRLQRIKTVRDHRFSKLGCQLAGTYRISNSAGAFEEVNFEKDTMAGRFVVGLEKMTRRRPVGRRW